MIKEALSFLVGLGKDAATNQVHEINGVQFAGGDLDLTAVLMPSPDCLKMTTLSGLVDYVVANRDALDLAKFVIHVESPVTVSLCGPLMHETEQRFRYLVSSPLLPKVSLEIFLDAERFNMQLQYGFVDTECRRDLLAFIGSIRQEASVGTEDDGVTQTVTAKAGIARVAEVPAPNPVLLRPFRTFPEIEQPESAFVLRMRTGPEVGLWEADGGAWRNTAMLDIKAYLADKLPELAVLA